MPAHNTALLYVYQLTYSFSADWSMSSQYHLRNAGLPTFLFPFGLTPTISGERVGMCRCCYWELHKITQHKTQKPNKTMNVNKCLFECQWFWHCKQSIVLCAGALFRGFGFSLIQDYRVDYQTSLSPSHCNLVNGQMKEWMGTTWVVYYLIFQDGNKLFLICSYRAENV